MGELDGVAAFALMVHLLACQPGGDSLSALQVRTAITLTAVGMVLSKSSLFLAADLDAGTILAVEVLGSALVGLGVAVVAAGYWRQLTISVALQQGCFPLSTRLSSLLLLCAFAGMGACFLSICSAMHTQEAAAGLAAARPGRREWGARQRPA